MMFHPTGKEITIQSEKDIPKEFVGKIVLFVEPGLIPGVKDFGGMVFGALGYDFESGKISSIDLVVKSGEKPLSLPLEESVLLKYGPLEMRLPTAEEMQLLQKRIVENKCRFSHDERHYGRLIRQIITTPNNNPDFGLTLRA